MNNEIEQIENWQWAWCNNYTGMPIGGSPSGGMMSAYSPEQYSMRYIQLGTKSIHKDCGGEVAKKFDTQWKDSCSFTKWWQECERCGKKFNETDYE